MFFATCACVHISNNIKTFLKKDLYVVATQNITVMLKQTNMESNMKIHPEYKAATFTALLHIMRDMSGRIERETNAALVAIRPSPTDSLSPNFNLAIGSLLAIQTDVNEYIRLMDCLIALHKQ